MITKECYKVIKSLSQHDQAILISCLSSNDRVELGRLALPDLSEKLKEPIGLKVNHKGHLFTFGESTIEVEYIGVDHTFPFHQVNKGDKQ